MLIDLESIQHKLSSDYSLTVYFSRRFPYIDGPSFSPYKPLQNVDFSKVVTCSFFRNYTHIFTRTKGGKFEYIFLVKIASKVTSLSLVSIKPISTTTNFELKQSDSVQRMTARPPNRFVFCVVVAEFPVNGNQASVSFLYKDKWW